MALNGHGEKGVCKFRDARSWSSVEMKSMCVDFPGDVYSGTTRFIQLECLGYKALGDLEADVLKSYSCTMMKQEGGAFAHFGSWEGWLRQYERGLCRVLV